jgi:small-conductance mechanosensitive channel
MKTTPGEQFPMKRKAYVLIKKVFAENGITIPIPTVQVKGEESAAAAAASITAMASPSSASG